jgi:hypothetical protein
MKKLILVAGIGALTAAGQANILVNPGFETGDMAPWVVGFSGGVDDWHVIAGGQSGAFSATAAGNTQIRQDFAPVAGSDVSMISFWMMHPNSGSAPSAVDLFYDDFTFEENLISSTTTEWEFFDVTSFVNTSKTLVAIGIWGYSSAGGDADRTNLDDVDIEAVPEPASLLSLAGVSLLLLRRRR